MDEERRTIFLGQLRKMGLSREGAERWLADWEMQSAPLVKSTVVYEPPPLPRRVIRLGRFVIKEARADV